MVNFPRIFSRKNPSPHGYIIRYLTIKNDFIGYHAYKDAPDEVAFLKNRHRHKFYVESTIQVFHDDRELEFFMVQEKIERDIIPYLFLSGLGSCEMIAEDIMWGLINAYGDHREYLTTVSEDNENDATTQWLPNH